MTEILRSIEGNLIGLDKDDNLLVKLSGYIQPSANGTFAIRCKSEIAVAAGLTVKAGSWLRIWETDN